MAEAVVKVPGRVAAAAAKAVTGVSGRVAAVAGAMVKVSGRVAAVAEVLSGVSGRVTVTVAGVVLAAPCDVDYDRLPEYSTSHETTAESNDTALVSLAGSLNLDIVVGRESSTLEDHGIEVPPELDRLLEGVKVLVSAVPLQISQVVLVERMVACW